MVRRRRTPLAAIVLLALVVAACSGGGETRAASRSTSTVAAPSTTSTTAPPLPPPTTTTTTAPPAGLAPGAKGPEVETLQRRLVELRYDPGSVDGSYGGGTAQAVMAFQKVHGMERTGKATPDVLAALDTAAAPAPLVPDGGPTRVEVNLGRQVLFLYKDGALDRILNASSGTGKRYCDGGVCGVAVTPPGSFRVYKRIDGWRRSRLGLLYNPLYFRGGIAIHGAKSVPAHPASHGCVRIAMHSAEWFPAAVPNGTPVYVVAPGEPAAPLAEPPPMASTTSTTTPPAPATTSTTTASTTSTTSTTAPLPTSTTLPAP